ncbi:DUF2199 domain-containing protein [Lentzea sp.]|uniref:DUF2199 domain-containing protein n=1 Tax=Lentzea sp. TaxID=56099 RepID=UPI002C437623|nr:DUF2199 domain-containing protein [Lentzea sp.]HUQ54855.1 DUF2199 domain-containing protein [Lentzea sp.]
MTTQAVERCACCGATISNPGRVDVTVGLPDGVVPTAETNPNAAFLRIPTGQVFVRCLLPVALTGGTTMTYMTWMETTQADFQRATEAWRGSSWDGTVLHGTLGNDLKPWTESLRGAEIMATVHSADEPPTVTNSEHALLRRMLTETWDSDTVLSWFPGPLPLAIQVRVGRHWSVERGEGMVTGVGDAGWRFGGPGRSVFVEVLTDPLRRPADEYLGELLANAPEVPRDQSLYVPTADDITHAFWVETVADGRPQHDFYAHVVRQGTALSMGAFYSDPDDHQWALHVLRSVRHHV